VRHGRQLGLHHKADIAFGVATFIPGVGGIAWGARAAVTAYKVARAVKIADAVGRSEIGRYAIKEALSNGGRTIAMEVKDPAFKMLWQSRPTSTAGVLQSGRSSRRFGSGRALLPSCQRRSPPLQCLYYLGVGG
jgi:hypothetical protein